MSPLTYCLALTTTGLLLVGLHHLFPCPLWVYDSELGLESGTRDNSPR